MGGVRLLTRPKSTMIYLYISTALLAVSLLMLAIQVRNQSSQTRKYDKRIKHLESELQAAALINQTLGKRLLATESEGRRMDGLIAELQEFGKNDLFQQKTFKQASKMAQLGASTDELRRSCDLSQGEAELLRHLNQSELPATAEVH